MDESQKRSLLIIAVVATAGLLGYYFLFPPTPEPSRRPPPVADAGHPGTRPGTPNAPLGAPVVLSEAQRTERLRTQRTATIDTPQFRATFTNLNAGLVHYELKGERFTHTVDDPLRPGVKRRAPMDLVTTSQE